MCSGARLTHFERRWERCEHSRSRCRAETRRRAGVGRDLVERVAGSISRGRGREILRPCPRIPAVPSRGASHDGRRHGGPRPDVAARPTEVSPPPGNRNAKATTEGRGRLFKHKHQLRGVPSSGLHVATTSRATGTSDHKQGLERDGTHRGIRCGRGTHVPVLSPLRCRDQANDCPQIKISW